MLVFLILIFFPPKSFWKIYVISLKERSSFIKLLFHARMFRVEALPAVRTLEFFLPIAAFVFVLLQARRLFLLLVLNFRIRSFEFGFGVLLLLSFPLGILGSRSKEGLITGGFDDPHLDKLIMLAC